MGPMGDGGVAKWLWTEPAKNVPPGEGGSSDSPEADFRGVSEISLSDYRLVARRNFRVAR